MDIQSLYYDLQTFYNANRRAHHFLNPRYEMNYNTLTWEKHIPNEKFDTYHEYYDWAVNKIQYSFMLQDESIVQIFFEGEPKKKKFIVTKGSMAYLPRPDKYSEYFRFDVDYKSAQHFNHTAYHVHFGYRAKDVRFSLFHFPAPSEFIKFILSLDYNQPQQCFNAQNFFKDLDEINNNYNHSLRFVTE
ncbi:hypothetical protein [Bacillus anthracis]|uniref:hypothetical protein n=1 Tax=Bacillus anthracis TaxID=1392 RepID=UPI00099C47AB|nr:hypothetical protein [Bacillus anthracis]OPD59415.1 hypothetical protein BVG01_07845 [Bacillus anthracis]